MVYCCMQYHVYGRGYYECADLEETPNPNTKAPDMENHVPSLCPLSGLVLTTNRV